MTRIDHAHRWPVCFIPSFLFFYMHAFFFRATLQLGLGLQNSFIFALFPNSCCLISQHVFFMPPNPQESSTGARLGLDVVTVSTTLQNS